MSIPVVHIKFEKDISNFSLNMVYTKEEFEKAVEDGIRK